MQFPDGALLHLSLGKNCQHIQKTFQVTLANTPFLRQKGFSGRTKPLSSNEGMFFVFEKPEQSVVFWMKDTFIPLQIGFFDEQGRLVKTEEMSVETNPSATPLKYYVHAGITVAALEVSPHGLDKLSLKKTVLCVEK